MVGVIATLERFCSVKVSKLIPVRFRITPDWAILAILIVGWLQNDLRRAMRSSERLAVLAGWNESVGYQLGIVIAVAL